VSDNQLSGIALDRRTGGALEAGEKDICTEPHANGRADAIVKARGQGLGAGERPSVRRDV